MSAVGEHPGDLLSAWIDGEVTPIEAAGVVAHLADCIACAAERDRVDAARGALRALPTLDAPAGVLRAAPAVHVGDMISARLDDEMAVDLLPGVDAHLAACPACAAEHDEVAWARTALRALPPLDPPAEVLRPAGAWPAPPASRPVRHARRPRTRQLVAATAAVAAASVGVLGLVGRPGPTDTTRPAVASFVAQHSTSSPGPDAVSGLAPAALPISFSR